MSNKVTYLISLILVLVLTSVSPADLDNDPNLVGWWPFDGDANDVSGNGLNGSLVGDAHFEAGYINQAIALDGDGDYVNIDGWEGILGTSAVSAAAWINTSNTTSGAFIGWGPNTAAQRFGFRHNASRLRFEHHGGNIQGNSTMVDGEWHHVAVTIKEAATISYPDVKLYLDGVDDTIVTTDPDAFNLTAAGDARIGSRPASNDRFFDGLMDDVRIYNRELSLGEVRILAGLLISYNPDPADGAMIEATSALLQWTAGPYAAQFDVYFGTNPTPGADELVGRQSEVSYMALDLTEDQTYYWRIDDVQEDGTIRVGDVWSFWIPPKRAYNPEPSNGLINVSDLEIDLSWTGGWSPVMHAVYFGTDADQVANASGAAPLMDAGYDPGPLEIGTTYYWRVDEFYGTEWIAGPVWSFTTVPAIEATGDPNLVVWWPLDEGEALTALDMSGNGHHGSLVGDPEWVEGLSGSALHLRGDTNKDYVVYDFEVAEPFEAGTVAIWVKADIVGQAQYSSPFSSHYPNSAGFQIDTNGASPGSYRTNPQTGNLFGPVVTDWIHLVVTWENEASNYYYNGNLVASGTFSTTETTFNEFLLGLNRNRDGHFQGILDDFRVYDRALSADEAKQLTRYDLSQAWDPQPVHLGSSPIWTSLTWQAGDGATEHDVYLGTNKDAVASADASDVTGIYLGRQAGTTYVPSLSWAKTYYWRIDEVATDGTISTGRVWNFTTTDEIVLYDVATPFPYDNSVDPFLSEIALELDPAQDWTHPVGRIALSYDGMASPGSVTQADGVYTVVGRGDDIWSTSDQFQFAHTTLTGDGTMVVKVESLSASDDWTKAGIMIRESLDPGSAFAAIYVTGANGVRFQARSMANMDADSDSSVATAEQNALTAPVWLKIERTFPMISAYYSTDGVAWTPMAWNPQVIPMTVLPIYIGLAVTSHSGDSTYAEAVFSELSSSGGVAAGSLTSTEIGLEANGAEPMYLMLEDTSGATSAVLNPDPAATQQVGAEWIIDLDEFNIDRTAVVKASLVIGDISNPTPGGAGTLTINSVKLLPGIPVIVWVSDNRVAGREQGWIDMLQANGYDVDLSFQNQEGRELDASEIEALEAADLIIVGRDMLSGQYSNQITEWNSLSTPLIMINGWLPGSTRWNWLEVSTNTQRDVSNLQAVIPDHPVFDGVSLDANNQVSMLTESSQFTDTTDPGNGTLIATNVSNGDVWIVEWQTGQEFYPGSGQIAGGPRMLFIAGNQPSPGEYNLTADGEKVFLNAASLMVEAGVPK
ncbi:MAG: hypothetical protein JXM79_12385 [Sedimentisphaerales bacterium]|nr:hypothetical protein [Sedimentisphaerales bacterium]